MRFPLRKRPWRFGMWLIFAATLRFILFSVWENPSVFLQMKKTPVEAMEYPRTLSSPPTLASTVDSLDPIGVPRWKDPDGINLAPILRLLTGVLEGTSSSITWSKDARTSFPETLYIVDIDGVWMSRTLRDRNERPQRSHRLRPVEAMMNAAWQRLLRETNNTTRWPNALRSMNSNGGLPLVHWYGDYFLCNENNWWDEATNTSYSIPLFTNGALSTCESTFPMVTYKSIQAAKPSSTDWDELFENQALSKTHRKRIRKVVWRGSLTDKRLAFRDGLERPPRWRLAQVAATRPDILDVGLTFSPRRKPQPQWDLEQEIGGYVDPIYPMSSLQNYSGVIDIDGNAWSSRLGPQLCLDTVTLKVEPRFVDHFYSQLQPWVHYIPVRNDLSDLIERADWVIDPQNADFVERIRQAAHEWCRSELTFPALAEQVLNSWEVYATELFRNDPQWRKRLSQWRHRRSIQESFGFELVEHFLDETK